MSISRTDFEAMRRRCLRTANGVAPGNVVGSGDMVPCSGFRVPGSGSNAVRIRQGEKLLNRLESEWLAHLELLHPAVKFRAQAIRFRLANGAWYKPDVCAWLNDRLVCWECKGGRGMKGHARGMLTVKVAAATWPEALFILVWKDAGQWRQQEVLA